MTSKPALSHFQQVRSFNWTEIGCAILLQGVEQERLALSTDKGVTWQVLSLPAIEIGYPSGYPLLVIDSGDAAACACANR